MCFSKKIILEVLAITIRQGKEIKGTQTGKASKTVTICPWHVTIYGGGLVAKSYPTLVTPWTVACQALLSMEFSRQEYWSGLPFPSPRYLPSPETEPRSPTLEADSLPSEQLNQSINRSDTFLWLCQFLKKKKLRFSQILNTNSICFVAFINLCL